MNSLISKILVRMAFMVASRRSRRRGSSMWIGVAVLYAMSFGSTRLVLSQTASQATDAAPRFDGVVVEKVTKDSEADRAGIQPGDFLLDWATADAKGRIESPFNLHSVTLEWGSRGRTTIHGSRAQEEKTWVLDPIFSNKDWGISLRPPMSGSLALAYDRGLK